MKKIYALLVLVFTFTVVSSQSVTITQPNGAETLYGCQNYQVKWNATGVSNNWNIDYSLNSGAIWTSVATNLNITPISGVYTYNWTVPMVASNTVLVRVRDYADTTKQDQSNAVFTIVLPITITSPNGGEVWQGLSNQLITWTPAGTSGIFNISYSTNNGSSWATVASNIAANNYNWTVPNTPSNQSLVRVQDATTSCQLDISNAVFEISAAQPILTAPNGGEIWTINSNRTITWNTATFHTTVKLEYSTDNGATYNLITASTSNTGSYTWNIPNTPSTQVIVKASNSSGSSVFDVSNSVFTIQQPANFITAPNGGEIWRALNSENITWNNTLFVSDVKIEYSINNGTSWNLIVGSTSNSGSYVWTIPQSAVSTQALVRITNNTVSTIIDTSNAVFTIVPPLTVDAPNGGVTLTSCSPYVIYYTRPNSYSSTSYYYNIYYSINGGTSWTTISSYTSNNSASAVQSYNWTPPALTSTQLRIKVELINSSGTVIFVDSSDANNTINLPSGLITVTNPNGGVTTNALTNYNITWTASGSSGFFDIHYSRTGANGSYALIASNVSGNSYNWSVPNLPSTNMFVRVRDNQNVCRFDSSNAANTIVAATPILTAPNGGQVWNVNTNQNITWNTATFYNNVFIEFSTDNGSTWNTVIASTSNTGSYTWSVPNLQSTQCLIRVSNVGAPTPFDVSDAPFTIQLPTPILTSPNGGEVWRSLNTENITWNSGSVASNVQIQYSINGGATWSDIVASTGNTGSYPWTIPNNLNTTQALVRIINVSFPSAIDTSNAVFTIVPPLTVDAPNGGVTLTSCSPYVIYYTRPNSYSSTSYYYNIYYSINGGTSWTTISSYTSNNSASAVQSYNWTPPALTSTQLRIKVEMITSLGTVVFVDSSDANNTINLPSGLITVTNPNGGVSLNALSTYNITWTASGTSGFFDIHYSRTGANGSYALIASNVNSNSYVWTIPNLPSTNVFVRVRDNQNVCRFDSSNTANTIVAAQPVLTSPNGGEIWTSLSNRNITWDAATFYNNVFIEFSIDNGVTWNNVIASTSNTGSYTWNTPFLNSTQCLIRISNVGNPSLFDVSNANFTIQIPTPVLTAPNGGETWYAGTSQNITWVPSTVFASTVNLYYSLDSGLTWTTIVSGVSNSGTYNWSSIPNLYSTKAFIKIENAGYPTYFDVNNALFTFKPYVLITTPNGGNVLGACTQTTITFEKAPFYTAFNIEYSTDSGTTWVALQTNATYTNTINNYNWSIPNAPTTKALVRVTPFNVPSRADISDAVFTIQRAVTIIQPNFGGVLQVGTSYQIKWLSDGISNIYDIAYSTAGSSGPWTNIVLGYNTSTNTYNWTVPNTPSNNCFIRIRDNINSCKEDISDVAFTISTTANPITVTAPNGGDSLSACQSYNITWTEVGGPIGTYNIGYSVDGGNSYIPIVSNYATTSYSYNWTVPNINAPNVLVRVQSAPNPASFDLSNALFKIVPGRLFTNNDTTICSGNSVQLNTTGGSSYSWTPTAGLSNPTIPNPLATPSTTTLYIVSSTSGGCALSDSVLITVNPNSGLTASVIVTPTPSTAVCAGTNVLFTATPTNGGFSPSYQWKLNGTNVGTNTYTYSSSTLANGNVVSCVMTSSLQCVTNQVSTSNSVTMTIFPIVTPTIAISTASTSICSGANVTFTATATNTGGAPVYQWKKNGVNVGSNANTYSTNGLANNDVISCELTSNANCASPVTVTSNSLLITVNATTTPTISISTPITSICAGTSVTFTANTTNVGATPVYQWKRNGSNVGTGLSTFTTTTLANNDVITCDVTSSAACNSIATVTSNAISMSVATSVVPAVSITATATNICAGTSVTFTAVPTNGGTTPAYQWKINGVNAGSNSSTYTSSALNNNDVVTCVMTSSSGCASPTTATSTGITMTVNPTSAPTVSVTASATTICSGTNVTFTATASNAGSSPSFQWKRNGTDVGGNSATFNTSALATNDSIWCVVTSSSSCASPNTSVSNKVFMIVNPVVTPSVSINTTTNNVCASTSVLFTATPTNGGSNPSYQWKVNGVNVGFNSSTYSTTSLVNGDVVSCVLTSNVSCATTTTATSNAITMTVTPATSPSISISSTATSICSGVTVTFTATATNSGASPGYQWRLNGTNISGATSANYVSNTLANNDAISCVVTSSANCASPATASSNTILMTVSPTVTPSITISASTTSICSGASATFTASALNGGTTPAYQWKVNGTNVGTNSPTYTSASLTNGSVVTCVLTSNASCATSTTATSNGITITVNSTVTPSVTISATATSICSGTSVTFSSSVTNGGGTPTYQWKKNGTNISGATASSYSTTTLANNDVITLDVTSSAACASPATASSNSITITVTPSVAASISISASSTSICTGNSVTFTATPTNGGSTPVYQWKVNGTNVGANSNSFSTSSLNNNDIVTCQLTSNATCVTGSPATSNAITMNVTTPAAPTVSITSSATTICSGISVTFNATVTNAGTSPVYQWKVNGNNAGTNASSFTSTSLANTDIITCVFTSTNSCSGTSSATSNAITMTVNPSVVPDVTVSASSTNICAGNSVTFTATPTNGGSSPSYQWQRNGANVGSNSTTYTTTTLANGDVVRCVLTSNATCAVPAVDTSNAVIITVGSNATPTVSISASATSICTGNAVTFTATPTNGGTSPTYQWKVNGTNAGTGGSSFTSSSLNNGDVVTVVLTSNANCVSSTTATSNAITIIVSPAVTPSVAVSASATTICSGQNVTFTATPTNGGSTPSYQWKLNGNNVGTNSNSYSNAALANGDVVTVVMTSSATCPSVATATATPTTITVSPSVTPSVTISASATSVCAGQNVTFTATPTNGGSTPTYQWYRNSTLVGTNSATFSTSSISNADVISCVLTTSAPCFTVQKDTSNLITMTVNATVAPSVSISASQTTICAGATVNFTATPTNGGTSPSYQWKVNGTNVGTNSNLFTSSSLVNGDVVTVVITSNAACPSPATATSNAVTIVVSPAVTPSVAVSASATTICSGQNVTFTATPTNGGSTPSYQWKLNGNNVGTNSNSYSNAALANGDVVTVVMTSSATCPSVATATATPTTITVSPSVTPSVTISASATSVCAGQNVTFTATPTNGGSTPTYQWYRNSTLVGTNSATFSTSSISNADVISCVLTTSAPCFTVQKDTSNLITMTVNATVAPSVSISASQTTICAGATVNFTATPTNGGTSPSYQWKVNGTNVGTNSNLFTSSSLVNGDVVTVVITSNAACPSPATATSNAVTIVVSPAVTPSVAVSASATTICSGQNVTFTATPTNGGSTPSYQWKLNGNNVGTNSNSYSNAALANGDVVTVVMTSSATCPSVATATATPTTITVSPSVTPSVTISASATSVCAGQNVTFTATPTNGGSTPTYQWYRNSTLVGTNSATFSTSSISNADEISCVLTTSAPCFTVQKDTSNLITMTVNATVAPSVSISASQTTICAGATVNFTATPTNGGTSPSYQWKVNGTNVGTNSNLFTSSSLVNGDVVTVVITSNAACPSPATATSNAVTIVVSPAVTPSVAVSASATTICSGQNVTFTATPTNGGSTPSYQWKLNGNNVGTNSNSYSNAALANGDVVTVVMTSSATCPSVATATATPTTITVSTATAPEITIAESVNNICAGTAVTFTSTVSNGGSNPSYAWYVNGVLYGTSANFTSTTLTNGQVVGCVLTTTSGCSTTPTDTSNLIAMTILPSLTPSIVISTANSSVCTGASVSFTASISNGGSTPAYQWKVNGVNAGSNNNTFIAGSLANNDVVTCELTSSDACANPVVVTSNAITITISSPVTPTVSITTVNSTICAGQFVSFTATAINGGTTPTYQWKVNGNNAGINSSVFSTTTLSNGDQVSCELTSNAGCTTTSTATSNSITITVTLPVTPTVSISASAAIICSGQTINFTATAVNGGVAPIYQWKVNGINVGSNSATFSYSSFNNNDVVSCELTSSESCVTSATATSNPITVTVSNSITPSVSIAATSTTICSGENVVFTATATNGGTAPQYQWKLNGNNVGTNSSSYASSSLQNGDIVSCELVSNGVCVSTTPVLSNNMGITVNASVTPTVNINPATVNICAGASQTFSAQITNGGLMPSLQWFVNGISTGQLGATYTTTTLNNGDLITCQLNSNATCATTNSVVSAAVTANVSVAVTPTVSISANTLTICNGQAVTFNATPVNGGTAPTYQWMINGSNVGLNTASFTYSNFSNGDIVNCVMTSNAGCLTANTASSNNLTITIGGAVTPTISITASSNPVCENTTVTFTTTVTNEGLTPSYQWKLNGVNVGSNSATYSSSTLVDGDVVSCVLTSSVSCASPSNITSNSLVMNIGVTPATPTISVNGNTLTSSAVTGNQWYYSSNPINGAVNQTYTINQSGWYSVRVTSNEGCVVISDSVQVIYTDVEELMPEQINVWPVPAQVYVHINIPSGIEISEVALTDVKGSLISHKNNIQPHEDHWRIDLSDVAQGVYFMNIKVGEKFVTKKVIIAR